jgi:hypothetical protein
MVSHTRPRPRASGRRSIALASPAPRPRPPDPHVLSGFFGRQVRLARAAPEDFTIDQYHPDIERLGSLGG